MDLFSLFQAQIPTTANKLLIAFSGGLDSTALLSLVKKLSKKTTALKPASYSYPSWIKPQRGCLDGSLPTTL